MNGRSMADAVRAILVKRAFVPGDPNAGGMPPPGGDPNAGGMPPPGGDPNAGGMPPPGGDPMGGMPPPGMDPSMMGGMPPPGMDPSMMGGMPMGGDPMAGMPPPPQSGMINMTADEFTKFIKQMMAAFQGGGAPAPQQTQPDIGAKLDTLIAVLQGKSGAQV